MRSKLWVGVGEPGFVYPERRAGGAVAEAAATRDPDLAICLSGGGERAALLALGNVAAARKSRVSLPRRAFRPRRAPRDARSSVLDARRGTPCAVLAARRGTRAQVIAPEDLTKEASGNHQKSFGKSVKRAHFLSDMKNKFFWDKINPLKRFGQETPSYRAWAECIGNAFLDRYGLNDEQCFAVWTSNFGLPSTRIEELVSTRRKVRSKR